MVRVGGVAQLGEHLLCKQGVVGSIPIVSTTHTSRLACWARTHAFGHVGQTLLGLGPGKVEVVTEKNEFGTWLSAPPTGADGFGPVWCCGSDPVAHDLCQCESGSGASLGALHRNCLTGKCGPGVSWVRGCQRCGGCVQGREMCVLSSKGLL